MTTRNLHLGLELVSPVYYSNGTICRVSPSQQIDSGAKMKASFGIAFMQNYFKGALLYKLQRKYADETDNQPNSSTVSIEDATKNTYLLVVWDIGHVQHNFYVRLIECASDFTWDQDKLWALHWDCNDEIYVDYGSDAITWLMHDSAMLKTRCDIIYGSDYKLDIVIYEGT
jgi:hypothetical protein